MIRVVLLSLLPCPALAVTFDMPANAVMTAEDSSTSDSYDMPVASWAADGMPVQTASGAVTQQAWRIEATGLTTFQIIDPLQQQLTDDGFDIVFTCEDTVCGGFDFRFATRVVSAPQMQVNFGDYRYVAAQRGTGDGLELVSLLASRTSLAGYVQITRVGTGPAADLADTSAPAVQGNGPIVTGDLGTQLEGMGRFVLSDLTFETGSAQLGDAAFASLQDLADYLVANPDRTVALVGHTDAVGALEGNIALSKRRAGSVLERLVTNYGIPRRQLEAQGMGYLSPIASNVTQDGRDANRRVEVIITLTQ